MVTTHSLRHLSFFNLIIFEIRHPFSPVPKPSQIHSRALDSAFLLLLVNFAPRWIVLGIVRNRYCCPLDSESFSLSTG